MNTVNNFNGKSEEYIAAIKKHSNNASFTHAITGTAVGVATLGVLVGATPVGLTILIGCAALASAHKVYLTHQKIQVSTENSFKGTANKFLSKSLLKMSAMSFGMGFSGGFYGAAATAMLLAGSVASLPAIAVGGAIAVGVATLGAKIGTQTMTEAAEFKVPSVLSFLKQRTSACEPANKISKNRPSLS